MSILSLTHIIGKSFGLFPQFLLIAYKNLFSYPPVYFSNLFGPADQIFLDEIPVTEINIGVNLPINAPRGLNL